MEPGVFQRKLHSLNNHLRIYCGDNNAKAAGLFYVLCGEYVEICGVDKNAIPEKIIWDDRGHIVKGGWRRAVEILIKKRLIDKRKAQKEFNTSFNPKMLTSIQRAQDPVLNMIKQIKVKHWFQDPETHEERPVYHKDYLVDVGRAIAKFRGRG